MDQPKRKMTSVERKRKTREKQAKKMTEEEKVLFKEQETERIKKLMQLKCDKQKLTMSPTELCIHKNEAARIRTLREKKKEANRKTASALLRITPGNLNPYKTRQSFSKALNKIRTELPNSPCKKLAVVKGLASELGFAIDKQSRKPITNNMKEKIEAFYYRTDIVYTMPGAKDEIVVWDVSGKQRLRKYHLIVNLKEAHALYQETCEDEFKCSFSKFCGWWLRFECYYKNSICMGQFQGTLANINLTCPFIHHTWANIQHV